MYIVSRLIFFILGYIGDKAGYKITLMLTLTATAAEIVIFTFLPKYKTMPKFKVIKAFVYSKFWSQTLCYADTNPNCNSC